jgi:Secretion system C-terminal sorting domain
MKNTLTFLFSVLILNSFAQWQVVGKRNFSAGAVNSINIQINSKGTPYVACQDAGVANKASVMMYDGANWIQVGPAGFSTGAANNIHFGIDKNDTLYVVYSDGLDSLLYVKKFNGTNWLTIGNVGRKSPDTDIAFDKNNKPFIAMSTLFAGYGNDTVFVKSFDGLNWQTVGGTYACTEGKWPDIDLDTLGNIYLITEGTAFNYGTGAYKFDGITWAGIGGFGYQSGARLKVDKNAAVYVAVNGYNYMSQGPAQLKKYNSGLSWSNVFVLSAPYYLIGDIDFDLYSNVFFLFNQGTYAMLYDVVGVNTSYTSTNYSTNGKCRVAIDHSSDSLSGSVYIAFNDSASRISVISIKNPVGIPSLNKELANIKVFPNPASNFITIKSSKEIGVVIIYNSLGEIVLRNKISASESQLDISKLPSGIYTIYAQGGYTKICKE